MKEDLKNKQTSFAFEICQMLKSDNKRLFIVNIVLSVALIITLIALILK